MQDGHNLCKIAQNGAAPYRAGPHEQTSPDWLFLDGQQHRQQGERGHLVLHQRWWWPMQAPPLVLARAGWSYQRHACHWDKAALAGLQQQPAAVGSSSRERCGNTEECLPGVLLSASCPCCSVAAVRFKSMRCSVSPAVQSSCPTERMACGGVCTASLSGSSFGREGCGWELAVGLSMPWRWFCSVRSAQLQARRWV